MKYKLGYRIKELRQKLGLSQRQFGEKLGLSFQHISKYERGEVAPTSEVLTKIGEIYSVNLNWLLTGQGEPFIKKEVKEGIDPVTEKILILLGDMDEEKRRDVLKYIEEKKLLQELLEERKKLKDAG